MQSQSPLDELSTATARLDARPMHEDVGRQKASNHHTTPSRNATTGLLELNHESHPIPLQVLTRFWLEDLQVGGDDLELLNWGNASAHRFDGCGARFVHGFWSPTTSIFAVPQGDPHALASLTINKKECGLVAIHTLSRG
jgi:hypothetical protein